MSYSSFRILNWLTSDRDYLINYSPFSIFRIETLSNGFNFKSPKPYKSSSSFKHDTIDLFDTAYLSRVHSLAIFLLQHGISAELSLSESVRNSVRYIYLKRVFSIMSAVSIFFLLFTFILLAKEYGYPSTYEFSGLQPALLLTKNQLVDYNEVIKHSLISNPN